jgi:Derlin-2/3
MLNVFVTSGHVLASALALAFVTTSTRDSWDQPMTLFIIKMPSQYLPYALLLLTLICASPKAAMIQGTGLLAAYTYDLLTGLYPKSGIKRNWISTPAWMKRIFGTQAVVERPYGTVFAPASWGVDMSWKKFGPGRALDGRTVEVEGDSATEASHRPTGLALAALVVGSFLVFSTLIGMFLVYGVPDGWFSGVDVGKMLDSPRSGDVTPSPDSLKTT